MDTDTDVASQELNPARRARPWRPGWQELAPRDGRDAGSSDGATMASGAHLVRRA
jgi:hypothetical protein